MKKGFFYGDDNPDQDQQMTRLTGEIMSPATIHKGLKHPPRQVPQPSIGLPKITNTIQNDEMMHPASLVAEPQVMFESNEGVVTEFADASL